MHSNHCCMLIMLILVQTTFFSAAFIPVCKTAFSLGVFLSLNAHDFFMYYYRWCERGMLRNTSETVTQANCFLVCYWCWCAQSFWIVILFASNWGIIMTCYDCMHKCLMVLIDNVLYDAYLIIHPCDAHLLGVSTKLYTCLYYYRCNAWNYCVVAIVTDYLRRYVTMHA